MFCEKQLSTNHTRIRTGPAELQIDQSVRFFSWFGVYKSAYLVPRQMRKLRSVPVQAGHTFWVALLWKIPSRTRPRISLLYCLRYWMFGTGPWDCLYRIFVINCCLVLWITTQISPVTNCLSVPLLDRTHAFVDSHLSRNYVDASRALQKHSGNLSNIPSFFLWTFRLALFTTFVTAPSRPMDDLCARQPV